MLFYEEEEEEGKEEEVVVDLFVCFFLWGFYAVSTVFQLFNGDSSQAHVSLTNFNQCLTSPDNSRPVVVSFP